MAAARALEQIVALEPGSRLISWLPAAHIAERMAHHYIPVVYAATVTCCPNPRDIVSFLPQVRPTWFFAVPRIWEKLKSGLEAMLAAQPAEQREPVERALAAARERVRLRQQGASRCPPISRRGSPCRRANLSQASAQCSASTRPWPSTPGRRPRRWR